ncbi:MAG: PPOX class F420-dependent oxidoreductase [Rhodoglobus sp.]
MTPHELETLAGHTYVSLTTFRRSGAPVATPVWVVADGDRLLITTGVKSGKVARIRRSGRVELTACDMRGTLVEGAVAVSATATVHHDDATMHALDAALRTKYGAKYAAIRLAQKLRGATRESVAVVVAVDVRG